MLTTNRPAHVVRTALTLLALSAPSAISHAEKSAGKGEVTVPLEDYQSLLDSHHDAAAPAPAHFAVGDSKIKVEVTDADGGATAKIVADVIIKLFEDRWTS